MPRLPVTHWHRADAHANCYLGPTKEIVWRFDRPGLGAYWLLGHEGEPTMPRYFFQLFDDDNQNLVRDSEGASFVNSREAKKEAFALAQNIAGHRLHQPNWQIVVTDENADCRKSIPVRGSPKQSAI
jgi:hypothetical protein